MGRAVGEVSPRYLDRGGAAGDRRRRRRPRVDVNVRRLHERRSVHRPGAPRAAARGAARHAARSRARASSRPAPRAASPSGRPISTVASGAHDIVLATGCGEDDRRRRRHGDLRAVDRRRSGVRVLSRHHLPRPVRDDGPGAHAPLRHVAPAACRGGGEEPPARLDEPARPVPQQGHVPSRWRTR